MAKIMNASQKFPEGEPSPACFQEDHRLWGPQSLLLQYSSVLKRVFQSVQLNKDAKTPPSIIKE